jgi:2-C-methyl-D-erythritol 2,4-cyclodiphosphate synthase
VSDPLPFRIGSGFDVHRLVAGRKLFLGGVEIPHDKGLDGHSDADALLHAIADALLGAVGAGDIGHHFPNTDPRWKDCASHVFVRECARVIAQQGYTVGNVDATVLAERPKIAPHIPAMRSAIAAMLGIEPDRVSIKATTMEQLGAIGRREGIAAMASVMVMRVLKKTP